MLEFFATYRLGVDIRGELLEKYQEGLWVGKFSCGYLRNAIAGRLRKISCG
jgi:hypothetical protein